MPKYRIVIEVDGKNINTIQKQMEATFPQQAVRVAKMGDGNSRQARLDEASVMVEDAAQIVSELHDEMQEWYDSIPENLQQGEKANEVEEEREALETLKDELEGVDFTSASNFPGMF